MKALVVEDPERLRRALGEGLRRLGFVVDLAGDGIEGLKFANAAEYDVIVLDIMLPGVDGLTLLKNLRRRRILHRFFGDLVDLANDMQRTVNNLMMLSQLDAGTQRVDLASINLSQLIDKTWKRLVPEADRKEVRLDNRVRDNLEVNSDGDKLRLILVNLLSNAISYSPDRSAILVEAEETESGARLAVSNPTVDLAEQDLAMMFERFWRKDEARTGGRHAGLGLSLVQALADILSLKINSVLDRGRRFTIMLSEFQSI